MINRNEGKLPDVCSPEPGVPVFEINPDSTTRYPNGDKLPGILVTAPVRDREGNILGRRYTMAYPPQGGDPQGEEALWQGGCYYEEAMEYTDAADREKRVDCFRATELLYRHAAGKGNAVANMCLGYVYSYDRCEGRYWVDPDAAEAAAPYPRKERAFACFFAAAQACIPEACYKLGDMYKNGVGCEPDGREAYRWYARSQELATRGERPVILGSIALRLADCYEEGLGCEQSFPLALKMFRRAVSALEVAVDTGETWYEKPLAAARAGVKRCEQELA